MHALPMHMQPRWWGEILSDPPQSNFALGICMHASTHSLTALLSDIFALLTTHSSPCSLPTHPHTCSTVRGPREMSMIILLRYSFCCETQQHIPIHTYSVTH
jgi:hypothetical protein